MAARRLGEAEWTETVKKIYALLGTERAVTTSRMEISEALDEPVRSVQSFLAVARHLGILELTYRRHESGQGRASEYRLMVPMDEAMQRLEHFGWENITSYKEDGRQPRKAREKVALASPTDGGEVRAIAGPDKPSPFAILRPMRYDQSAAQVEAAKQYRDRVAFLELELQRFDERGIKVDKAAFRIPTDPRLDAITLALPYIEGLEKQVQNMEARLKEAGDAPRLRELLRQKEAELAGCRDRKMAEVSQRVLRDRRDSQPD